MFERTCNKDEIPSWGAVCIELSNGTEVEVSCVGGDVLAVAKGEPGSTPVVYNTETDGRGMIYVEHK